MTERKNKVRQPKNIQKKKKGEKKDKENMRKQCIEVKNNLKEEIQYRRKNKRNERKIP